MRILHVSTEPARHGSAAEAHLKGIYEGLERRGYNLTQQWRRESHGLGSIGAMLQHQVATAVRLARADVVYFRWHPLDIGLALFCRILRRRYVLEINGLLDDLLDSHPRVRFLAPLLKRGTSMQFKKAAGLIFVSSPLRDFVNEREGWLPPSVVVPCKAPESLKKFRTTEPTEPHQVLYIGKLMERQGVEEALSARHSVLWPKGVELRFVGDGPLEDLIRQHERDHGCCRFIGPLPRNELYPIVSGALGTLSLQPGRFPRNRVMGMPLKIVESAVLGVPVVFSDLSDLSFHLHGLPGFAAVLAEDADQVALAVSHLPPDGGTRACIASLADDRLTWQSAAVATAEFLERL